MTVQNIGKAYLPEEDELPMCLDREEEASMFGDDDGPEWLKPVMEGNGDDQSEDDGPA